MERTTISLMQELDLLTNKQVVIAATNREDRLDPALKRRFFQKKEMSIFGKQERQEMAAKFLDDVGIEYSRSEIAEYSGERRTQADMIKFATQIVIRKVVQENVGG